MVELSTELLAEIGGWPALKEARGLVERGRVSDVRREGAVVRGRVQGAEKAYDAQIVLGARVAAVEVKCTCVESRRSGRVCAHALAVGLFALRPIATTPAVPARQAQPPAGPRRWRLGQEPEGTPRVEVTFLLPLNLRESLAKDPVRVILEGKITGENQPWDALAPMLARGFAVSEEDEVALAALERAVGAVAGINQVPRARLGEWLHRLGGHPRVWSGKKERIEIRATAERPRIDVRSREDGSLELNVFVSGAAQRSGPLPGWSLEGAVLSENPVAPPGFVEGRRVIPHAAIPDFLAREWAELERTCDLALPPGLEFRLETAQPVIEARIDGGLAGLTLELVAHYGTHAFSLGWKADAEAKTYFTDARDLHRFWCRDATAEKIAAVEVQAAGFQPVRGGGLAFSLVQEKNVARFLANTLPRWRREWTITPGPRLEATLAQIDVAEPTLSLHGGSGEDWLSLDLQLAVNGKPVPLDAAEVQRWLQTGQNHARTADRRVLLIPTEAWGEMREVLADCDVAQEPGRLRVARTYAPYLAGALAEQGFHIARNDAAETAKPDVRAWLDPGLWNRLRPYQAEGVEWMAGLAQRGLHGLLADDMGLGKTLQALAFCAWLRATEETPAPALVVCPTSLVANWLREAARFTPHLRTLDLTGPDRAERRAATSQADLVVTSYAILRRDLETFRAMEFSLLVLDEAQHIKNRGSQNAQSAKALRSRHRLILTGTPLENSALDLWSLFDFLLPGYLGTAADFRERYETPLTKGEAPRIMARLRQRVRPFFLRRTKEEVLKDLPPKLEHLTLCELSDEQREVYRAILAEGRREVFDKAGKSGGGRDRIAVLTTLLRLRQVCCHLDLLPHGDAPRTWKEPSIKLERTFELIDEAIDGGHRVLLFSQFVQALHLLRDEARRRELRFCYLDGQTVERQGEVDRFQNDANIPLFFISLKAGGTGLNLTGADTVIHFDPWWNPAVEDQATSRAHRLGQARAVQAYKLIAAGTVEEKIQALQARKRELFQASLGDEAFVAGLTGDEMEELLAE
jgi:superfamily II DNA or RNA helicase